MADMHINKCNDIKQTIENSLISCVNKNHLGFDVYYQPIFKCNCTNVKMLYSCEALLRWTNPDSNQSISPDTFIPLLENNGMIVDVGKYVINQALEQCSLWRMIMPDLKININISARQLEDDGFVSFLMDAIDELNIDASAIILELTETYKIDALLIGNTFALLRAHGIHVAFDDFGIGYSSLNNLRIVQVDSIKIDRSFVENILTNVQDKIILKCIVDMSRELSVDLCIEGIETSDMESVILAMGCIFVQGYLYSKPLTASQFEKSYMLSIVSGGGIATV